MYDDSERGNTDTKPDVQSFTAILYAWSNPKSALRAERADAILLQMMDPYASGELNTKASRHHLLQHCLSCWVKSPWNGSTEKAEKILCEMQALYALVDKGVKPDVASYTTVIKADAHTGNVDQAEEELLGEMYNDYQQGNTDAKPNAWSFSVVFSA
jgi:hypothetical protein